jgi:hypothetical protein
MTGPIDAGCQAGKSEATRARELGTRELGTGQMSSVGQMSGSTLLKSG